MNESDAFGFGDGDDAFDVEIRADRAFALSDFVGFIGFEAMHREAVFVGVNGDGGNAQFGGGAKDANRNFRAVGDEKFMR